MTTPSTEKNRTTDDNAQKKKQGSVLFWSVRARMSAAMLPTLVAPKRMDGWSDADVVCLSVRLSLSLSSYRGGSLLGASPHLCARLR